MGGVDLGSTLHFADQLPVLDGVMLDPVSGFVAAASQGHKDGSQGHFAQLSMHDVAVILKVEFFNQGRAEFSLDAFDPLEPFGEFQKKDGWAKKRIDGTPHDLNFLVFDILPCACGRYFALSSWQEQMWVNSSFEQMYF